jgi:hypothetical protein
MLLSLSLSLYIYMYCSISEQCNSERKTKERRTQRISPR